MAKAFNAEHARQVLFHRADVNRLSHRLLKIRQGEHRAGVSGLPFYIADLDRIMRPARGGELITFLASTSHYKTGMMSYIARQAAMDSQRRSNLRADKKREVFFFATWEDSIEKVGIGDIAYSTGLDIEAMEDGKFSDEEMMLIIKAIIDHNSYPLLMIGHSERSLASRPEITLNQVHDAIDLASNELNEDVCIGGIFLDYLQRIHITGGESQRRMQVARNVEQCKNMALQYNCPVYLGCQAGRQVALRDIKIPTRYDGLETSNIEQTSDRLLALYMPKFDYRTMDLLPSDYVTDYDDPIYVTEDLVIVEILKQKRGSVGARVPLRVKFNTNQITSL